MSGVWDKVPKGRTIIFEDIQNFFGTQCTIGERQLPCQKLAQPFSTEHRLVTGTDTCLARYIMDWRPCGYRQQRQTQ